MWAIRTTYAAMLPFCKLQYQFSPFAVLAGSFRTCVGAMFSVIDRHPQSRSGCRCNSAFISNTNMAAPTSTIARILAERRALTRSVGRRPLVVLRKITFGSRSDAGAHRMAKIMTVGETARRHGHRASQIYFELYTRPPTRVLRRLYAGGKQAAA